MSKISTYEVAPVPKLADKLIGTSVGGEIEDVTYNFTLQELLDVFLPVIPANNLQGVLDYGNTATQDINLFGTITTTNLEVTDTANFLDSYFVGETHIVGGLFDSEDSIGLAGQVLTSTGEFVEWVTLPPIFTPNLQQVLDIGNTSDTGIILDAGLEALNVDTDTATINTNITIDGTITDGDASVGATGTVLSSTVTGVKWVALPVYSATSPLLFNSATGVFSIQQATNSQSGYLSSSDWITFDGKQNAGNYITALTGEATASGPGSASVTLSNAAVIGKVLTGFNPTAGTINASDSILTAFGKTQSQINALVGGVQYQGVWNASTNVPTLVSSVGVQGHYYVVNVAGNTNLNGITDWQIGDWAIFSESVWQKVDNTESVTSVNGFTGAVSLTTDNIPEGTTNLYFLNSRARTALSFAAGSGAYNNVSGVITIPTDNSQILNGAGYITLGSLSASSPLVYNNLTGAFSIPKATTLVDGYLSATDWTTFNNKQNYLGGTGLVKSTAGTITYITDNSGNWNTAYDRSIVSAAVTGTTTKTLTLNEQDGNTITASWTDLDTGLTSIGVSMPSAFSVANSPLTSNGTIAVTGAGTSLQYIDGTGALQTFPGLTGFVPYTGATTNVDLGEFGISSGYFQADLTPIGALQVGRMQWNATEGTMDLRLMGNNVTLQIGQENVTRVVNKSGIDLLEANYQVVRIRKVAEGGAQGQRLAVVLAQGNNENNSTEVLGLVTETINSNQEGFITNFGEVKGINTTGSIQGETWVDGDVVYLSAVTPGQLTNIRPIAPNHAVIVGYVTYAHINNGKIYVSVDTGYELGELHNVYAPSPTANQSIYWNVANSRYQLNTIGGILGYTPADAATTLTINGTTYDLSANRTWSVGTVTSVAALTLGTTGTDLSSSVATGTTTPVITLNVPTASAANRGALSAADWSTFNTKVGGVTASSPLASSGGSTPNITIQQSSGSQDGYLSSTDWTTFNNKQAAGNYITSLTGEATATGPGAAAVTLNNASVTAKVLTGINITGGTVQATDTMLTAFGKLQNQINGLIGSTIYQGTWNASTNTPALASGVGVRGYYYIVSVAGNTNLDGITDWFVGDWAIFDGTAWQQVDNTDAVVSVNGQTGAVSLTTDNIPEGATNQYYLDSRARAALSFTAGSGAYNSTTGVITIPTNTNQLTNGASFITLASLSGTAPIGYNNTTGAISITQAGTASNGFLSSTDWNTFNNKQPAGSYVTLTGVETLSNKTFSNVVNLSVNGYILAGATGVNPLQMYSTTLTSNFLFSSNSFGTNINNDLFYSKNSSNRSVLSFNNTAERTYTFPNASGTIALTSDIPSLTGYVTIDTTQTITGQKTISRAAAIFSGTTQSFLIDGAGGQASITLNAASFNYSYQTFAQGGVGKFEMGIVGNGNNGSLYINSNVQTGETGASIYIKKADGFVGINNINPTYRLDVSGQSRVSGAFGSTFGLLVDGTTYGIVGVNRGQIASSAGINYYTALAQKWFTGIYENTDNFGFYNATNATFPMVVTTANNVGIGTFHVTGTPESLLHVSGTSAGAFLPTLTLTNLGGTAGTAVGINFGVDNSTSGAITAPNAAIRVTSTNTSGDSNMEFRVYASSGGTFNVYATISATSSFTFDIAGTGRYQGQLTVTNAATTTPILCNGVNQQQYIYISSSVGYEAMSRYYNATAGDWYTGIRANAGLTDTASYHIYSSTYGNDVLAITTGGTTVVRALGIGVNPTQAAALVFADVTGAKILFNNNANNYRIDLVTNVEGGDAMMKFIAGSTGAGEFGFYNGSTLAQLITASGRTVFNANASSITGYGSTVQSVLVNGTNGALTINSNGGSPYSYLNFAQGLVTKVEIGCEGASTNQGSLYINTNIQSGSTGASIWVQKSNGFVGMGRITADYPLDVNGDIRSGRLRNQGNLVLSSYQTVNPSSNVYLYSTPNDRDMWIMLDSADTGSNWGMYYRQIDSALVIGGQQTLPANSVAFVGSGANTLQAYICLADGTAYVRNTLTSGGGFFDISDKRVKTLIQDNYLLNSISNVKAKLYIKNGVKELGYYAQDLEEILPYAVNKSVDGFLSLSYSQVHTAKIAVIEDEVTILKNKVYELEFKLQKYEA